MYADDLRPISSKEKRAELVEGIMDSELVAPAEQRDQSKVQASDPKKKKKKRSTLSNSRQSSQVQNELQWLNNVETNRNLKTVTA